MDENRDIYESLFLDDCLCKDCRNRLVRNKKVIEIEGIQVKALYIYNDQASQWMMQIKEAHDKTLANVFVYPFVHKLRRQFKHKTIIIVPSSNHKTQERTYHALKEMFDCLHIELIDAFNKEDVKQSKGGKIERKNIAKYISLKDDSIKYGPIVLIDDICTTGESLKACIHLLRDHCESIECFVCCLHPLWLNKDTLI